MKKWLAILLALLGTAVSVVGTYSQEDQPESDPTAFLQSGEIGGEDAQVPNGAQLVLRGPVHEAFAQPARVKPQPGPIVPKEPPRPIEEIPPDQKPAGENVQWIPGYWFWDEEKQEFLWVSGIWRAIPPGMEWVPGTWVQVEGGWQWVPGYWKPVVQEGVEVVPEPPEPPPLADPPPPPGPDYYYVPGNWVYISYRWYWRPGIWVLCRPGWVWVPACYHWTPYGYVFVDGYWDYPFAARGVVFCPIWVDYAVCYRPGWFWRPCYWVPEPCLVSFLFVHTRRFCFFFGDYYDPFYARSGFVSIYYYRVHRGCYDPLLGYYAMRYGRHDRDWLARQRTLVQARMVGRELRPPRSLEEQRKLLASAAGDQERQNKLRQVLVAGSINRVDTKKLALQKLDEKQLAALRKNIEENRQVQLQRAALERDLAKTKRETGKPPAKVQPVAVKSTAQVKVPKPPPPAPVLAKKDLKPSVPQVPTEPTQPGDKSRIGKPSVGEKNQPIDKSKPSRPREEKTKPGNQPTSSGKHSEERPAPSSTPRDAKSGDGSTGPRPIDGKKTPSGSKASESTTPASSDRPRSPTKPPERSNVPPKPAPARPPAERNSRSSQSVNERRSLGTPATQTIPDIVDRHAPRGASEWRQTPAVPERSPVPNARPERPSRSQTGSLLPPSDGSVSRLRASDEFSNRRMLVSPSTTERALPSASRIRTSDLSPISPVRSGRTSTVLPERFSRSIVVPRSGLVSPVRISPSYERGARPSHSSRYR